ncbi:PAS domain S-box-containing protein [Mucilaginibacter lappiensis]|uniref:histidine kinase n=1 Tax=Mucilaginibacter lappiensis TaxID=354630 RepID=A0ABR6PKE4_9SPHI|nr:PAS domain S-box protein [Mucilaginibacter lappiensis]MBB6110242.1 PAS domain S-box-containing protein [Mucilaginibacter lappiensis]SIR27539.1 PAS domain S-box-containing protein [Mucilaginibacter lappiensis]
MENLTDLQQLLAQYKQREAELERSEARLRMAIASANLGTWDYKPLTGELTWSDECKHLYGMAPEAEINFELFTEHIYPADRDVLELAMKRAMDPLGDHIYDITYRIIRFDSPEVRWLRAQGKVYFNKLQEPERFIGTIVDQTQAKLAEEKSAKLAAIVESSDDAIIGKNLDGVITSWNPAAERLLGYTEKDVIGKHITMLIPEDRLEEEDLILERIRSNKKVEHYVTFRVTKAGLEIPVSISVSPIRDVNGVVIGAAKIIRNNAHQKETEARLLRYAENLEVLNALGKVISERMDVSDILQKVTDATTRLIGAAFGAFFYNNVTEAGESYMLFALSGAPREAFERFGIPKNTDLFHPTFTGERIVRADDITKDPRYGQNSPFFGMPEGHLQVVSYLAVPVISKSGLVIGGLFYGHPEPAKFTREHEQLVSGVATQAAIALDNTKLYEEIRKLNDKKEEFIGLASHELKTPVTSLSGYLQILNRSLPDTDRNKPFLQKALLQVKKLSELISDLLDVSKIETGQLPLSFSNFNITQIVQETIELIQYSTKTHQIVLQQPEQEIIISADKQRIEQVIVNLLSNAIKYSPYEKLVNVAISVVHNEVRVAVQDYGMGILKEHQERIFSRFYRVEELASHISGLGIGLYISKEIITRHHGKLWLDSEPEKGSTFFFEIPLNT